MGMGMTGTTISIPCATGIRRTCLRIFLLWLRLGNGYPRFFRRRENNGVTGTAVHAPWRLCGRFDISAAWDSGACHLIVFRHRIVFHWASKAARAFRRSATAAEAWVVGAASAASIWRSKVERAALTLVRLSGPLAGAPRPLPAAAPSSAAISGVLDWSLRISSRALEALSRSS